MAVGLPLCSCDGGACACALHKAPGGAQMHHLLLLRIIKQLRYRSFSAHPCYYMALKRYGTYKARLRVRRLQDHPGARRSCSVVSLAPASFSFGLRREARSWKLYSPTTSDATCFPAGRKRSRSAPTAGVVDFPPALDDALEHRRASCVVGLTSSLQARAFILEEHSEVVRKWLDPMTLSKTALSPMLRVLLVQDIPASVRHVPRPPLASSCSTSFTTFSASTPLIRLRRSTCSACR